MLTTRLLLTGLLAFSAAYGTPLYLYAPNDAQTTEGPQFNSYPFDLGRIANGPPSERYQQVYSASMFSSLTQPYWITQIAFRPDSAYGNAFSGAVFPDVQIDLSTTTRGPTHLVTTFASNVGADDTVVYDGSLTLSSAHHCPGSGPCDFDIVIDLATPYLYTPGVNNNLLLDVHMYSAVTTSMFDAIANSSLMSRAYAPDVNATAATPMSLYSYYALDTRFTLTDQLVPEPLSLGLVGSGFLALAVWRFRRRDRQSHPGNGFNF